MMLKPEPYGPNATETGKFPAAKGDPATGVNAPLSPMQ